MADYQLSHLTLSTRIELAAHMLDPMRPWGKVTDLSREHSVSRKFLYELRDKARQATLEALTAKEAGRKANSKVIEIDDSFVKRAIAVSLSVIPGTIRTVQSLLDLLFGVHRATGYISQPAKEMGREALESIYLYAPIEGTAISVDILPGETVLAGVPVIRLADMSELRVETTDLSERDIAQVAVGQDVTVYIEALDLEVPGTVMRIAPQADVIGGDVVYTVVVELDELPDGLRWGMTVEVSIETE